MSMTGRGPAMRAKAVLVILALIGCLLPLGVQAQTGTGQGRSEPSGAIGWLCMIYAPNPAASGALEPFVAGPVQLSQDRRRLRAPVRSGGGLATTVVRALDAAGVTVDDVEVHQPSLDDVFFALTGRPAEIAEERDEADLEVARS